MPTRTIVVIAAVVTSFACSSGSPVTPSAAPEPMTSSVAAGGQDASAQRVGTVAGTYDLTFADSTLQPVITLPACDGEMILKAHVQDQVSGGIDPTGSVVFEYCSYGGVPNDITRADEAPMAACAAGEAKWRRLGMQSVNQSGDAYLDFGVVRVPRTVGFRFRYVQRSGGIASGIGGPEDFTWSAGSCP